MTDRDSDEGYLVINSRLRIPVTEFEFTYARSSGPGGQNVNKVSSKALLRWPVLSSPSLPDTIRTRLVARQRRRISSVGDLLISSQRFRDAPRNAADCLEKLREMLVEAATIPKSRRPTTPTRGSVRRRLTDKRQRSERKQSRRALGE